MFFDFRERGEGRERERERNISVREKHRSVPPIQAPTKDQTCNPGVCPDWESKPQPFGAWNDAPANGAIPARAEVSF